MPGCTLRVGGPSFDPDAFLQTSGLPISRTWRTGEPFYKSGRHPERVYHDGGFQCDVSDADGLLRQQIVDAEAFLTRHREDLASVAAHPLVEYCDLDFGYWCRLGHGIAMHGEYVPASFLQLAGQLRVGVALSLYPKGDEVAI